ncbi:MAG: helix-turn-helix domain-containing protein [Alphaproteobacteria bacterium]
MNYDLLHIQGKPFVLVPLHDYRTMNSSDTMQKSALPDHILDQIAARSEHPVKILRKFYGLTQEELAARSGLSRSYLTEIETGAKEGSLKSLKALSEALDVDLSVLA